MHPLLLIVIVAIVVIVAIAWHDLRTRGGEGQTPVGGSGGGEPTPSSKPRGPADQT